MVSLAYMMPKPKAPATQRKHSKSGWLASSVWGMAEVTCAVGAGVLPGVLPLATLGVALGVAVAVGAAGLSLPGCGVVAGAGVDAVLSGYVGPKAFEALQAAGIKVCQDLDGLTVREAVERFKSGGAPFADAPNK